ncbi:unnamed protein product [Ectocarpus fasciculatus]
MSPTAGKHQDSSAVARFAGSGASGVLELLLFHPVDTVAKRLMTNETKIFGSGSPVANMNNAIFKKHANASVMTKYGSLFPGIGYGAAYKVLQRMYKFGGQPYVKDYMMKNHSSGFKSTFGDKNYKTMISAVSGSLMGVGEILLLPLDVLKIKAQTNPESFKGRGVVKVFQDEGMNLYRGAGWTAARNAPGSFALFGGSAFVKDVVFALEDHRDATFLQETVGSVVGACASIAVAQPLDVIKTRIQKDAFAETQQSGFVIVGNLLKNEGPGAFFKGFAPKLLVVGPKLIFSFTIAQQLMGFFSKL